MKQALTGLLNWWHFPTGTYATLAATGEGLALLANLVNFSAKVVDEQYYDLKPAVINAAMVASNHCSLVDGIVYIETAVGQVSFHVFPEDEEIFDPRRTYDAWSYEETQFRAVELIESFLEEQT